MTTTNVHDESDHTSGQSAALALIVVTAIVVVILAAVARLGAVMVDRGAAQTAADAAALASLRGGRAAAVAVATANGAVLVAWSSDDAGDTVAVTVRVGSATASARATDAAPQVSGVVTGLGRP